MTKIPTIFKRGDDKRVVDELSSPAMAEILACTPGVYPTRKYDGTAVMVDDEQNIWQRYTWKPGRTQPDGFLPTGREDPVTHKISGWVPTAGDKWLTGALDAFARATEGMPSPGTYELCGPKINGNQECLPCHTLVYHGAVVLIDVPTTYAGLSEYLSKMPIEGIVWWRDRKPIAKLKGKDFGWKRA